MRFCSNCGLLADDLWLTHCPKCGAKLPRFTLDDLEEPPREEEPPRDEMTMGGYLLMLLVFLIPIVGFVMMLVWSFGREVPPARQRLAQAYLIRTLLAAVVVALLAVVVGVSLFTLLHAPYWGYYAW